MTWLRSEEEVDIMIEEMVARTKGRYITQGVTFNKSCPRQMGLLKKALLSSTSFSGLGKEMLALRFSENIVDSYVYPQLKEAKTKNVGNFI